MSAAQLSQLGRSRAGIRVSRATFPRTCRAGAHSGGRALCLCVSVGACAARACMQSSGTIRSSSNSRVTMRPRQSGRQAEAGDGGAPAPSPEDHATASDIQRSASSRHRTHSMGLSRYSRYSHYKEPAKDFFPPRSWIPTVTGTGLTKDFAAGATVAIMLIPQSLAYAVLAGLPPLYGMYASTVPLFVYALFASSTKLSVGPVATTAILINSSVAAFLGDEAATEEEVIRVTMALGFVSGVVQIALGLLRGGVLANLLSWAVMDGFVSAAGFIILSTQMRDLLGLTMERDNFFPVQVYRIFAAFDTIHIGTAILGIICLIVLLGAKKIEKLPRWVPVQLIVVLIALGISLIFDLEGSGVKVVGTIPMGFPTPSFPINGLAEFFRLIPSAFILSFVSYVGSVSLGLAFAQEAGEELDADQEFIALGAACLVGGVFASHTVSGSFTRTAVNNELGAKTPMACAFTGLLMVAVLMFAAAFFEKLPKCVLAAMICASVKSLLKWQTAKLMYKTHLPDFIQFTFAFFAVLFLGIDNGIVAAVVCALGMVVYKSFTPRIRTLGHLPNRPDLFMSKKRFPNVVEIPSVKVIRVDSAIHFGNVKRVVQKLRELLTASDIDESESIVSGDDRAIEDDANPGGENRSRSATNVSQGALQAIIMDFSRVSQVDLTTCREVKTVIEEFEERGVTLVFAAVPGPTRDTMRAAGIYTDKPQLYFMTVHEAVHKWALDHELTYEWDLRKRTFSGSVLPPLVATVDDDDLERKSDDVEVAIAGGHEAATEPRNNHTNNNSSTRTSATRAAAATGGGGGGGASARAVGGTADVRGSAPSTPVSRGTREEGSGDEEDNDDDDDDDGDDGEAEDGNSDLDDGDGDNAGASQRRTATTPQPPVSPSLV